MMNISCMVKSRQNSIPDRKAGKTDVPKKRSECWVGESNAFETS